MEKDEDKFRVSLVLPVGEYQYRYNNGESKRVIIDSEDYIVGQDQDELHLAINWLKTNDTGGYDILHGMHDNTVRLILHFVKNFKYTPTLNDVGALIKAEISCFKVGTQLFSVYDISKPTVVGRPRCKELKILGDAMEGKLLTASAKYFGGIEGKSTFKWHGPHDKVVNGREYRLDLNDVDNVIRLDYTPMRNDGTKGETVTATSENVLASIPTAADLTIQGQMAESETLHVSYRYYGGREGNTLIQWFKIVDNTDVVIGEATGKSYEIGTEDVRHKLKVVVTPVSTSGETGHKESFITTVVEPALPRLTRVGMAGEKFEEGSTLEADYDYYGGTEGKSTFEWFRVKGEKEVAGTDKAYTLTLEDVDRQIELQVTPVRDDGIAGVPDSIRSDTTVTPSKPRVVAIALIGAYIQDSTLKLKSEYRGGHEGASMITWLRSREKKSLGDWVVIESAQNQRDYKFTIDDVHHYIKVEYVPIRKDGVKGKMKEEIGELVTAPDPVMKDVNIVCPYLIEGEVIRGDASFYGGVEVSRNHKWIRIKDDEREEISGCTYNTYKLSTTDVGCKVIYAVQPVREDKAGEWTNSEETDVIAPRKPQVSSLRIDGDTIEGGSVICHVEGTDVSEEKSLYRWTRVVDDSEVELSSSQTYTIHHDDINRVLRCHFTPIRGDFDVRAEQQVVESEVIIPASPVVSSISINGTCEEGQTISCNTIYFGGDEGSSQIRWFRENTPIDRFNDRREYRLELDDVDHVIKVEYLPVRSDGVTGEKQTATTDKIAASFPTISDLQISGSATEDSVLSATATYYGGAEGTSLWRWRRVDGGSNAMVADETAEYKVTKKDIGVKIRFEYTPVRKDGVKGKLVSQDTEVVKAKPPTVSNVTVNGEPRVGSELTVSGTYHGGFEGASEIRWMISDNGNNFTTEIAKGAKLTPNPDQVGTFLKIIYIPVRDDGVQGAAVETNVVEISIDTTSVAQSLGNDKYEVTAGGINMKPSYKGLKLKNMQTGKAMADEKWDNLEFNVEGENGLLIVVKKSNTTHTVDCANTQERNTIAMTLRAFSALSNEALAKEVMGAAFATAWKKEKRAQAFSALGSEQSQPSINTANNTGHVKGAKVLLALRKAK
jgi:hypothetical protein